MKNGVGSMFCMISLFTIKFCFIHSHLCIKTCNFQLHSLQNIMIIGNYKSSFLFYITIF